MTEKAKPLTDADLIVDLPDSAATERLGQALAPYMSSRDVIALYGDLGAGKTSLARALIQALLAADGEMEDVPSPTFTLIQTYETQKLNIWHVDLYRLSHPDELIELGLEEALDTGLLIVEWPDRMGEELPPHRLDILFGEKGEGRTARLTPWGSVWEERLERMGPELRAQLEGGK
jgi:tRNA threonylcarbamoyladenosine biosynthesis protein TsaE